MPSVICGFVGKGRKWAAVRDCLCWCRGRRGGGGWPRIIHQKLTQKHNRLLGTRLAVGQELVAQAGSSGGGAHLGLGSQGVCGFLPDDDDADMMLLLLLCVLRQ